MFTKSMLVALVMVFGLGGAAKAADRYYMMIFASQARPTAAQSSHTFALFAKVVGEGANQQFETIPISWLPQGLKIEPLRRDPVAGVNLPIADTIRWAQSMNAQVSMWGPFPIKKDLYDMAAAQADKLAKGEIQYVMIDRHARGKGASNCIHAVSDMDSSQPLLNTGTAFGEEASKMVLSHLEPYILKPRTSNRWLVDRLGISPNVVRFINADLTAPR